MNEQRRPRKLADQITEFCTERGILQRDIADRMQISHPYMSQMISRGGTVEQIEKIAKVLDLDPFYFDRYHLLSFLERVETGDEWARECAMLLINGQKMPKRKQRDILGKLAA